MKHGGVSSLKQQASSDSAIILGQTRSLDFPVTPDAYQPFIGGVLNPFVTAIAGGFYIVFVILMAFVGAPIIAHILGHGPNDQFAGALDPKTVLPVGPWAHVSTQPYIGATGHFSNTLFILGGDG